jgi:two-component system response regulator YesN
MYKVALVDDDVLVLKFLETMIPWEKHGFEVTHAYKDSLEAYHHIKQHAYDLIITDIGMPKLNGIELISLLNEEGHDPVKVILSCHDEFHYAQQALKLDVFDYILKEAMDQGNIEELLQRVKIIIDDKRVKSSKSDAVTLFLKRNKNKLKMAFIERILEGHDIDDEAWWAEQGELLEMDFAGGYFTPVVCFIDKSDQALERYKRQTLLDFSIDNILSEILSACHVEGQIFYMQSKFYIIFSHREYKPREHSMAVDQVLQECHRQLRKYLKLTITTVIGQGSVTGKRLVNAIQELEANENQRFYYPHDSIQRLQVIPFEEQVIYEDFVAVVEKVKTSILKGDRNEVVELVGSQLKQLRKLRCNPFLVKEWAIKLVLDLKLRMQALSFFSESVLTGWTEQIVSRVHSMDELEEVVIEICEQFMQHLEQLENISPSREIAKLQKYVQMNIHKKISLTEVADYLHLNPSYLSRLFKKTMGEGFIEYVTRLKMEQARELLMDTTKTVEQIAFDLGFDSKSYFIKTFKKYYGVPPIDLRRVQ